MPESHRTLGEVEAQRAREILAEYEANSPRGATLHPHGALAHAVLAVYHELRHLTAWLNSQADDSDRLRNQREEMASREDHAMAMRRLASAIEKLRPPT